MMILERFFGNKKRRKATRKEEREKNASSRAAVNCLVCQAPPFDGRMAQYMDGSYELLRGPHGRHGHCTRPRGKGRYDWKRIQAQAKVRPMDLKLKQ